MLLSRRAMSVINFYGSTKSYGEFSNFYARKVHIDGKTWPTTEHYFQAMKFIHSPDYVEKIRTSESPAASKQLGQTRSVALRSDWEEVKNDVMLTALRAKFSQHRDLRELLLSTGTATLVEHTSNDRVWGDGGDGSGENRLGNMLMRVRDELQAAGAASKKSKVGAADDAAAGEKNDNSRSPAAKAAPANSAAGSAEDGSAAASEPAAAETVAEAASSTAATGDAGVLEFKTGDLLEATEQYIAHQCNCVTRYAKGLSQGLFAKFPHAEAYKNRKTPSTPGTVDIRGPPGRRVINMFAQYNPGAARSGDTSSQRLSWFKDCLRAIARISGLRSIAFPYMIGCGLGGGDWTQYNAALEEFAKQIAPARVVIYKLPEQPKKK